MGKRKIRPGQVGDFWPDRRKGRDSEDDPYFICWFDQRTRQVKRKRTVATDFEEACKLVREHAYLNDRPELAARDNLSIAKVLLIYFEEHAQNIPSARAAKYHILLWNEYWRDRPVSDITKAEQKKFCAWLEKGVKGKRSPSTIDKILATGAAALNYAVDEEYMDSAPKIRLIETAEEKAARDPLGEPITPITAAQLFDAAKTKRLMMFMMIALHTLSRPCAIYDLQPKQFDPEKNQIDLNPPGRRQTKKFRPKLPVTPTLRRWLEEYTDPDAFYLSGTNTKIKYLHKSFKKAVRDAGLSDDHNPYSYRHGLSRWMADHGVSDADTDQYLGHLAPGHKIRKIYTSTNPDRHKHGADVIELFMDEVRKHVKVARLDEPNYLYENPVAPKYGVRLSAKDGEIIQDLIEGGLSACEIARRVGCSETAVRKRKRKAERDASKDAFQLRAQKERLKRNFV